MNVSDKISFFVVSFVVAVETEAVGDLCLGRGRRSWRLLRGQWSKALLFGRFLLLNKEVCSCLVGVLFGRCRRRERHLTGSHQGCLVLADDFDFSLVFFGGTSPAPTRAALFSPMTLTLALSSSVA